MQMKGMKSYGKYGALGFELLISMAIGYYGGRWLDGKLGTRFLALVGFLLGCYAGFRAIFKAAKEMERDIVNEEKLARGEDPWEEKPAPSSRPRASVPAAPASSSPAKGASGNDATDGAVRDDPKSDEGDGDKSGTKSDGVV